MTVAIIEELKTFENALITNVDSIVTSEFFPYSRLKYNTDNVDELKKLKLQELKDHCKALIRKYNLTNLDSYPNIMALFAMNL